MPTRRTQRQPYLLAEHVPQIFNHHEQAMRCNNLKNRKAEGNQGGSDVVEVTVGIEVVDDGSTDVVEKVELDNDNFEMVEELLLVVLEKHQRNSGKKSAMIDVDNVEEIDKLSGVELPEVSLTLMDVLPPTSLVGGLSDPAHVPKPAMLVPEGSAPLTSVADT
ncbi:uncharacterized protein ARMOST_07955 [Armillaria ostoyae]|uniref:Uncharacterized protein n=1 Tax=Armillaria ostoyae TaxID=47428 RepID=A0A284R792_ARMOS|nr:uncharacterized protein ARMOST_07955 [Armillaria ostoyae]